MELSRFNVWSKYNKGLILFNTLTNALAFFSKKHTITMIKVFENQKIKNIPEEFLNAMIEDGYIIDKSCDELEIISNACKERQQRKNECSLCITLNSVCNFTCFYCFQKHTNKFLSQKDIKKILKMFEILTNTVENITVDWFGGEPLISFQTLQVLNNELITIAKKNNTKYTYSITTNGYLLNDAAINYFKSTPLSLITITVDGPPDIHNKSRPLKHGGDTFWMILDNIQQAVASDLKISIRVNMTSLNIHRIPELYNILEKMGLKNKVEINLQSVFSSPINPCEKYCLSNPVFAHYSMANYKYAAKKGWIIFPPANELRVLGFCTGEYPNHFITDLNSNLYRCGQMINSDSLGKIDENGHIFLEKEKNDLWIKKNPLNFSECKNCSILPLCMGGCNMKRFINNTDYCLSWKYNLKGLLEILLLNEKNIYLKEKL